MAVGMRVTAPPPHTAGSRRGVLTEIQLPDKGTEVIMLVRGGDDPLAEGLAVLDDHRVARLAPTA